MHADVDECTVNHGNCDKYANCTNFLGSYECTCMTGFAGDGFICTGVFINHGAEWSNDNTKQINKYIN